ncbi:LysR family transcriptional regulator [Microbacterium sorbitolivorans]|uniref:LysR family transcriptional regulator n=1 Tax=Microbacterium sorbitolivorans TaxID=1867410 RepID=A0A367Y699_9MICO|nr:LysR family transcriptional regulator [Microbacterium sorbitolivorans]RCK61395.1 LysR family transcriptional regulator [Microbacterium sorbitolivorans]GGF32591.1 LysR family transcriptional regulator [Microbacterium sorbitolivorans]
MSSPTLVDLRYFEASVRTGSISRAARELRVTQQAVSYRVRGLERILGLDLVTRSPFGITPTEAGEALLEASQEVLGAAERLDVLAAALRGTAAEASSFSVAASQTIASHLLPGWVMALRNSRQQRGAASVAVGLRTANSEEVIGLVRDGTVDLGFIEQPDVPRDLGSAIVGEDHMLVAVHPDHPWASRDGIPLDELAREALVSRERGSGTRATFESAVLREVGTVAAEPALVLATEAAVRSAVATGVAPAVVSWLTVHDDVRLHRMVTLPITPDAVSRPFTAIWRGSSRDLRQGARELVSIAAAHPGAAGH